MRRLPLFPLPTVLFPGMSVPLHIFEPRYRQMVAHAVERDSCFGLLYHDPDQRGPYETVPGAVGTIAEILKYQPLPDGRSVVLIRGDERFQVEDGIDSPHQYWECVASPYPDEDGPERGLLTRRRRSIRLFRDVLERVAHQYPHPFPRIDDREEAAYQIAQAIRIHPAWQQRLLEARSERDRLDQVDDLLHAVLESGVGDGEP